MAVSAAPLEETEYQFLFSKWVSQHSKQYATEHFFGKYNQWKSNLDTIIAHNQSGASFTMSMNHFGDLTSEEFKLQYLRTRPIMNRDFFRRSQNTEDLSGVAVAASVDWRSKNAVTPVKNQGQCGSCWAFSTTGSVEGAHAIKTGTLVSVSEQQLVDCAGSSGNQGCSGGLMDQAFEWIIQNKGLCAEADYAYTGTDGTCKKTCKNAVTITGYKDVTPGNETAIMPALNLGPVSIAIEADQSAFQFYSAGVLDGACGTNLDHGVLLVGYGTDATSKKDFWIVKNSWGSSWGEQGYVRIVRNKNMCGLTGFPSYPIA